MPLETALDRRTTMKLLLLIMVIGFTFVAFDVLPSSINENLFATVKDYVNNDPRCQTYLTYARPNINDLLGWSIAEYRWRGDWSVDWEQVNLFLNELDYYDEQAYWCDYYSIHPDDWQFSLFLWFQIGETAQNDSTTDFVFLYP